MSEMVTCEQDERISEMMSLNLDGLLSPDDERELQRHLATCPICKAEWEAMQQISALLEQSEIVGPPLGFALRVERRLTDQEKKRRRTFSGLALLTGSLSLAGVMAAAAVMLVLGGLAWNWLGGQPAVQQGTNTISQVASGVGLMGKGTTLFLKDLLVRYGPPLLLLVGVGLAFLVGLWAWLFVKRPGTSHRNGYA
jgi:anti-sigma factor RsiW